MHSSPMMKPYLPMQPHHVITDPIKSDASLVPGTINFHLAPFSSRSITILFTPGTEKSAYICFHTLSLLIFIGRSLLSLYSPSAHTLAANNRLVAAASLWGSFTLELIKSQLNPVKCLYSSPRRFDLSPGVVIAPSLHVFSVLHSSLLRNLGSRFTAPQMLMTKRGRGPPEWFGVKLKVTEKILKQIGIHLT